MGAATVGPEPVRAGLCEQFGCFADEYILLSWRLRGQTIALQLGFEVGDTPEFGFRARIPRDDKRLDRTEINMKLGTLLVESRITEADFQKQRPDLVESYRDFTDVFDTELLPRRNGQYVSYQLIRNVLAAHELGLSFTDPLFSKSRCLLPVAAMEK